MTDNLKLWNRVRTPPVSATKKTTLDGRQLTALNASWFFEKATEVWGQAGHGWGWEVHSSEVRDGAPVWKDHGDQLVCLGSEKIHTVTVLVWYLDQETGERCEVGPHFGHTKFVYWSNKRGAFITELEPHKKSLTDALKKCLSVLGFAQDVYAGLFDDRDYVEGARIREEMMGDTPAQRMTDENRALFEEKVNTAIKAIGLLGTRSAVEGFAERARTELISRARGMGYTKEQMAEYVHSLGAAMRGRIAELEGKVENHD